MSRARGNELERGGFAATGRADEPEARMRVRGVIEMSDFAGSDDADARDDIERGGIIAAFERGEHVQGDDGRIGARAIFFARK